MASHSFGAGSAQQDDAWLAFTTYKALPLTTLTTTRDPCTVFTCTKSTQASRSLQAYLRRDAAVNARLIPVVSVMPASSRGSRRTGISRAHHPSIHHAFGSLHKTWTTDSADRSPHLSHPIRPRNKAGDRCQRRVANKIPGYIEQAFAKLDHLVLLQIAG